MVKSDNYLYIVRFFRKAIDNPPLFRYNIVNNRKENIHLSLSEGRSETNIDKGNLFLGRKKRRFKGSVLKRVNGKVQ